MLPKFLICFVRQMDDDPVVEDDGAAAERGHVAAGLSDTDYSTIDFSVLKRRNSQKVGNSQETTETEYAEIKKEETRATQDEEGEQEAAMIQEDEGAAENTAEEAEGADVVMYSEVEDVINQV